MIALATPVKNARLTVIAQALDAGVSPGVLEIYTAPRPAPGEAITNQRLLVEIPFPKPCSAGVDNGLLTFAPIDDALCKQTGQAAWARFRDGDGHPVADGEVGLIGSGTEVELSTLALFAGGAVTVTVADLTE